MKIYEKINDRMTFRGVTQAEICRELGLTQSNFSLFLKGRRGLPYLKLIKVMRYLCLTFGAAGTDYSDVDLESAPVYFKKCASGLGMKNKDIQEKTGMLGTTFSSFVTGKRMVRISALESIMPTLGIDIVPFKPQQDKKTSIVYTPQKSIYDAVNSVIAQFAESSDEIVEIVLPPIVPSLEIDCVKIEKIPDGLEDNLTASVIVTNKVLAYLTDQSRKKTIKYAYSRLREGGAFVFVDYVESDIDDVLEHVCDIRKNKHALTLAEYKSALQEAGFSSVNVFWQEYNLYGIIARK